MENPIRVLVANRPRLMRELILETLADQPDIEIVGEVKDEADIPASVQSTHPDCLIIGMDNPGKRPPLCEALLRHHPALRIIALAPEQNYSLLFWGSHEIYAARIEASEQGILDAVRNRTRLVGKKC